MTLNLSVDEVLTTTRSVRKRLDLEKPVPREVLLECLESGAAGADGFQRPGLAMGLRRRPREEEGDRRHLPAQRHALSRPAQARVRRCARRAAATRDGSAKFLNEHLHEAPGLLVPCLEGRPDGAPAAMSASFWGSLLPAVWSFMLALRSRGLGSAWTTLHLLGDGEKQAAEVLGIPFDKYSQGGLFPIAYTKGTDFRPAKRLPAEQVTHWNNW